MGDLKFTTTTAASAAQGVKACVYGPAGAGKTVLCATTPAPIILSAESGLLSLSPDNLARMEVVLQRELPRDIPVIEIATYSDLVDAYNFVTTSPHAAAFETICLDSLSEIAERILANAKVTVRDIRQAYGQLIDDTRKAVKDFRDVKGKNVLMTAKQERTKDEVSGLMLYGPSLPGTRLGPDLPYLFDEVFHLNAARSPDGASSYRYLRTCPDAQYTAKDRSGALAEIEFPDLTRLFNKIRGNHGI